MIKIYGIKNCDTIKKTLKWFDAHQLPYTFIDYKKEPPTAELASTFLDAHHWETIINKRGTTWRKLDEQTKTEMDQTRAIALIQEQPSIIKRPIVENDGQLWVGYDEAQFEQFI
jgi:Spx/MgsR family transcriptional regulator